MEKAARGPDGRTYPWGEGVERSRANYGIDQEFGGPDDADGYLATAPVGSFPRGTSPYGLHDMAGNVREWVADLTDPLPPPDTTKMVSMDLGCYRDGEWHSSPDATWDTTYVVVHDSLTEAREIESCDADTRGGSFRSRPEDLRAAAHSTMLIGDSSGGTGSRCARHADLSREPDGSTGSDWPALSPWGQESPTGTR